MHESPWVMLAPLVILAVGSVVSGWVGVPQFLKGRDQFDHFLKPAIQTPAEVAASQEGASAPAPAEEQAESTSVELALAGTSVAVALLGIFFAWLLPATERTCCELLSPLPGLSNPHFLRFHGLRCASPVATACRPSGASTRRSGTARVKER